MSQGAVNILIVSAISRLGLVHNLYIFGYVIAFSFKSGKTLVFCWKKLDPSLYCYITILWRWYRHHWWWWCPPPLLLPSDPTLTEIGVFYWYLKKIHDMTTLFLASEKLTKHGFNKDWNIPCACIAWGLTSRGAHTLISQGFPNTHTHTHTHTHTWGIPWTDFVCHLRGRRLHQIEGWCDVI